MVKVDGGTLLARMLAAEGVKYVFSVSGGGINPLYRGCEELGIRVIRSRPDGSPLDPGTVQHTFKPHRPRPAGDGGAAHREHHRRRGHGSAWRRKGQGEHVGKMLAKGLWYFHDSFRR